MIALNSPPKILSLVLVNSGTSKKISEKLSVPNIRNIINIPIAKPKSPILFTIKALIAALFAVSLLNQNPINKYEHKPTPSHPKNNCRKLSDTTKHNIENVNKDKYDINLGL